MAGKKASLTLRLELRTIQPPANGKYVFSGICDAEDVVYTARSTPCGEAAATKTTFQEKAVLWREALAKR